MRELKIGVSSVRGVVGDALTPELAVDFACAFGTWCDGEPVVIARDTRRSSVMLRAAVVSGLLSCGCEVIDLELASSPLLSFAVRELGAAGGIAITGSHNDARWNALKFFGPDGALLNAVMTEELLDIYHARVFLSAPWDKLRPLAAEGWVAERYNEHLLSLLDVETIRARGFRVAMDFCNGTCAPPAARFLSSLGCTLYPFNDEPTGEFAHQPAPTASNMRQLASLTNVLQADLGAAINVDGDRLGFVAAGGRPLSEELTLPLCAMSRLARRPGTVVTNLSTSRRIDAVAAGYGCPVRRTAVGEAHVIDQGLAEEAVLAGEGSGGVAALPASVTFDGLLTLGLVLEAMATRDLGLEPLAASLPPYQMRKGQVPGPPATIYRVMDAVRQQWSDAAPNCSDGVRVDWPDGWLHIRGSSTEPLLRVIVEAESAQRADALYDEALTFVRRQTHGHQNGGN